MDQSINDVQENGEGVQVSQKISSNESAMLHIGIHGNLATW